MSLIRKQIKTSGLTIGGDVGAYEMPSSDGSVNQILKTDGSGKVDWITSSASSLQTSYTASAPASMVTTTGKPVIVQSGIGFDTQNQLEIQSETGVVNFSVAGDGTTGIRGSTIINDNGTYNNGIEIKGYTNAGSGGAGTIFFRENDATDIYGFTLGFDGSTKVPDIEQNELALIRYDGTGGNTVFRQGRNDEVLHFGGNINVDAIDTETVAPLLLGAEKANKVEIADTGIVTEVNGSLNVLQGVTINGNLTVKGTTTSVNSESVLLADNHIYLNKDYTTTSAQTGGLVVNYLPIDLSDTVAAAGFVAGVDGVSDPTVSTTGAAIFSENDIIQISGATDIANNGVFEVFAHTANILTIRSTGSGITDKVEDFTQDQFITDTNGTGTITKINVSVIRAGTDGIWESGTGSSTGLTFTDMNGDALTSGKLSQFASTTSAELASVIGDETGTGLLVFATSPTLTTPNLGAANATSVTATDMVSASTQRVVNGSNTTDITTSATETYSLVLPENAGSSDQLLSTDGTGVLSWASQKYDLVVAASDETTPLTADPNAPLTTFRAPRAFKLTSIRASLTTAQPSGTQLLTIDVHINGTTIMSTKITFDNDEKTSSTAPTQPVLSTQYISEDEEFTVFCDSVGDSGASGLKIILIGEVP
jgi:hypothetical protein